MHENLLRALHTLDLAPGASLSEIVARFRQLTKVWHPDKFLNPKEKSLAEHKLKEIIAAKELLQAHYTSGNHTNGPQCLCWGAPPPPPERPPEAHSERPSEPPGEDPLPPPRTKAPPPPQPAWDWAADLAKFLDLGPLSAGEPPWMETFRRLCESITGKHPGDTALEYFQKPPSFTKDRKRRSLLIGVFILVAFDTIALKIDPNAFGPAKPRVPAPAAPPASAPTPAKSPGLDFDSPEEIEKERLYFEQKWKEREDLLRRIRPGYKPSDG
ncbi:MAG: J domain-containing protein [Cyanobacteria bacterium SZAS TMP-1]|nr:J domain-containing protein [Cyanobacteria bacterium SZAS TMP-1]